MATFAASVLRVITQRMVRVLNVAGDLVVTLTSKGA